MVPDAADEAWSDDAALGGRLHLLQPRRGHRFGHEAILLAAATAGQAGEHAIELGAGIGAAGLALAWRVPGLRLTLVEIDPVLAAAAQRNAQRNGLDDRCRVVVADLSAPAAALVAAGLAPESADRVLMNPPFYDPESRQLSPDPGRRQAHAGGSATLAQWIGVAERLLRRRGVLTLIYPADGLAPMLAALAGAFGAVTLVPVHAKPEAPAIRLLANAVKGSRAPLRLLPPLTLTDTDGRQTPRAEEILRGGKALMPGNDAPAAPVGKP